ATGCGPRAWLAAPTGVPRTKAPAVVTARSSGHRRASALKSTAPPRLANRDARTLPASAAPVSSTGRAARKAAGRRAGSATLGRPLAMSTTNSTAARARAVIIEGSAGATRSPATSGSASGTRPATGYLRGPGERVGDAAGGVAVGDGPGEGDGFGGGEGPMSWARRWRW